MTGENLSGDAPFVSVVIPAHQAEAFLARAIASALGQSYASKEIIVVDDGSTDGTRTVAKGFGEAVRYLRQEHAGQAAATNRGIRASRGELVALLDADDEWLPERLERTVSPMVRDAGIGLCYCLAMLRRPDGYEEPRLPHRPVRKREGGVHWPERVCVPAVTLRRSLLDGVGLFDESMPHYNDHDLFLRIAEVARIHEVPEFLVRVYDRPASQQHSYPADTVVDTYLRVFYKALGRGRVEYDRDVTLSAAYASAAVWLWRGGARFRGLRYALASCLLRPNVGEMVGLVNGFVPRFLVRARSRIRGGSARPVEGDSEGEG